MYDAIINWSREILQGLERNGSDIPRYLAGDHSDAQHQMGLHLVENEARLIINGVKKCGRIVANPKFEGSDELTELLLLLISRSPKNLNLVVCSKAYAVMSSATLMFHNLRVSLRRNASPKPWVRNSTSPSLNLLLFPQLG